MRMGDLDLRSGSSRATARLWARIASRRETLEAVFLTEFVEEGLKRRSDQSDLGHLGVALALEVNDRVAEFLDKFPVEVQREPPSA